MNPIRLFFVCLAFISVQALASTQVIRTQHFDIIFPYPDGLALAEHLATKADQEYQDLWQQLNMPIAPRVSLVLSDNFGDQVNGFASLAGPPLVYLALNNTDSYELTGHGDTAVNILRHELVHIFAGRRYSDRVSWMPYLGYNMTPNIFAPLMFHEGYAIWFESDAQTGQGRALRHNPFYEGMWRQQYDSGFLSFEQAFAERSNLSYLYGAYFFTWAEEQYGADLVSRWLAERANRGSILRLVHLDPSWQRLTGDRFADSWRQFIQHETQRKAQLKQDSQSWQLVQQHLNAQRDYRAIYQDAELSAWVEHQQGMKPARLMVRYQGQERRLAYQPEFLLRQGQYLWFSQYQICQGRPLYSLYRLSLANMRVESMQECSRISHLAWSESTQRFVAWRQSDTGGDLLLLNAQGAVVELLQSFGPNVGIQSLNWQPKGQQILLHKKADWQSNYDLYLYDLQTSLWTQLTDDQNYYLDAYFLDEQTLVYSRQQGSYLQAFTWHLASEQEQQLSNLDRNAFSPRQVADGWQVLSEDDWGYQRVQIAPLERSQAKAALNRAHQPAELAEATQIRHRYYPIEQMRMAMWAPALGASPDGFVFGFSLSFMDPLQRHEVSIGSLYDTGAGNLFGSLAYGYKIGKHAYGLRFVEGATQLNEEVRQQESSLGLNYAWRNDSGKFSLRTSLVTDYVRQEQELDTQAWLGGGLRLADAKQGHKRILPNQSWSIDLASDWSAQTQAASAELNLGYSFATFGQSALQLSSRLLWTEDDAAISSTGETLSSLAGREVSTGMGLSVIDQPLVNDWLWRARLAHPVLLAEPKRMFGTWGLGAERLWLNPYAIAVGDDNQQQYNLGLELQLDLNLVWMIPVPIKFGLVSALEEGQWSDPFPYIRFGQ